MISVIIPIYNAELLLGDAIESVLGQSYKDFELILVNDGSTDRSGEICIAYSKKDSRIKYFQKNNSGVSDTRNYGIRHADGDFLVFVDADDTLPTDAFQVYIDTVTQTNADVIFANHSYDYNGSLLPRVPRVRNGIYTYQELQCRLLDDGTLSGILFGSVWAVFYKRSVISGNDIHFSDNVRVNEDGLFNISLLYYCNKIQVIDKSCYNYRQWKVRKTGELKRDERFDNCEREMLTLFTEREELDNYRDQLQCRQSSIAFWNAIRIGNADTSYREARKYLLEIFTDNSAAEGRKKLDYAHMNKYKRVLCKLMELKCTFLFYVIIRYLAPGLGKFAKR